MTIQQQLTSMIEGAAVVITFCGAQRRPFRAANNTHEPIQLSPPRSLEEKYDEGRSSGATMASMTKRGSVNTPKGERAAYQKS